MQIKRPHTRKYRAATSIAKQTSTRDISPLSCGSASNHKRTQRVASNQLESQRDEHIEKTCGRGATTNRPCDRIRKSANNAPFAKEQWPIRDNATLIEGSHWNRCPEGNHSLQPRNRSPTRKPTRVAEGAFTLKGFLQTSTISRYTHDLGFRSKPRSHDRTCRVVVASNARRPNRLGRPARLANAALLTIPAGMSFGRYVASPSAQRPAARTATECAPCASRQLSAPPLASPHTHLLFDFLPLLRS